MIDPKIQRQILPLKEAIVKNFDQENWLELGVLTGSADVIKGHDRLLRSLSWNDSDYPGNALHVLVTILEMHPDNFTFIKDYVDNKFPTGGEHISSGPDAPERRVYFTPTVFAVPPSETDPNLVAVMMPFGPKLDGVYEAIRAACAECGLTCSRVDNVWEHATIIQDIFSLIFRSFIVVCDFTGRNPNVFYEAGIAHTLGKHVIPLTQSAADIPFDLSHHRYLAYLNNSEGRSRLQDDLASRLQYLTSNR
jgi:hypothetical protein